MKKQKFKLPVKIVLIPAIILLAISLLIGYIWKVLTTSDFFAVGQVVVRNSSVSFDYLKGRNIFGLDLKGQAFKARLGCPDCRMVRFVRILPDCVFVDFVKRKPLALVKFYRDFAIDEQGVLFYPSGSAEEAGLPLIYGLETKIFKPTPGTRYYRPEINLALSIISEFKANKNLRGFTLKKVDVANPESAGFFMLLPQQEQLGFEVRTGGDNIGARMMILGGLVKQASKEWANIKYIDLRFKEPVIKLKDVL
ncbi:cell division protein FtsQ [bacterium]|nr:MAG: cell division protein FtsQ [bacterium]